MSTRAAIVRETGPSTFTGVYNHFDGYPSGLGRDLWRSYRRDYSGDIDRMLHDLVDVHCYKDFDPDRVITERNAEQCWCQYVYALGKDTKGRGRMRILTFDGAERKWRPLVEIALDRPEPDWQKLDAL